MARRGCTFLSFLPFLAISVALFVWGFLADPSALTDDGFPLKSFLFIMGGSFLFIPLVMVIGLSLAGAVRQKKVKDLLATGQQGEAVVLSLEDTGVRINDDPRVRMLLEVRIAGYPPYRVEKTLVVPLIRLSQVQVGSTVQVLADPSQPGNANKVGLLLK